MGGTTRLLFAIAMVLGLLSGGVGCVGSGPSSIDEAPFSVLRPAGWVEVRPKPKGGEWEELLRIQRPGQLPVISISAGPLTRNVRTDKDMANEVVVWARTGELVSQREVRLTDGSSAYELVFAGHAMSPFPSEEEAGRTLRLADVMTKDIFVVRGKTGFIAEGLTAADLFPEQEPLIDLILESFVVR